VPGATSVNNKSQGGGRNSYFRKKRIVEKCSSLISRVNVFPNPTAYDFTIQVRSKSNEPIMIIGIMDINGKVRSVENGVVRRQTT
jgi:hypothetical protein